MRCPLPNGDLETLISVKFDEDLVNIIEEYTIHTLIAIVESLKSNEVTVENSISTSTVVSKLDGEDGRIVLKAQLVILLGKAEEVEETAVPVVAA
ncbi:hypothetical protein ACFX14_028422 [Malus domestica]